MVSTYTLLEDSDMLQADVRIIRSKDAKHVPIGRLEVCNVGGDDHYGDYEITLYEDHNNGYRTTATGKLERFRRASGALALVRAALAAMHH